LKKILITGGCGFIGSHLVEHFLSKNLRIIVLEKKGIRKIPNWLKNLKNKKLQIIYDDIRNKNKVYELVKKSDFVIHLAALISIPHSYKFPDEHISTNILGTFNILEAIKLYGKGCIMTSTSETYGSGVKFPMDENHRLFAQSPYAASKISADQLGLSYYNSFDAKIKIIRPFNCFGPRQSTRAVIPSMISQILKMPKKIKLGNVNTSRDYVFVKDLCDAYWKLYKSPRGYGEVYNVGSGKSYKIKEIFKILAKKLKYKGKIEIEKARVRPIKSEVIKLLSSSKKFKKKFGWKPGNFKNQLSLTVDWFIQNKQYYKKTNYNF